MRGRCVVESAQQTGASCFFTGQLYPELTLSEVWMIPATDDAVTRWPPQVFTAIPGGLRIPLASQPGACTGAR